jgi:two-component system sensor histidine kinase KdpD
MGTYQRTVLGIAATVVGLLALLAVLLPFRSHLSTATPALVFVLPALIGVVVGGFVVGAIGAVAGFVFYDVFFLPPYNTLTVHSPQNWVALLVYVVVVLVVAQVVAQLSSAREDALRRTDESVRLYELSQTRSSLRRGRHSSCRPQSTDSSRWPRRRGSPWPRTT